MFCRMTPSALGTGLAGCATESAAGSQASCCEPRAHPSASKLFQRLTLVLALILLVALASAPGAFAHAQLLGTSPLSGSTVSAQPQEVIFKFNQDVGGTLGAVRVYNAQGSEVDDLDVSHPDGNEHWMGVGLKPHLPDGTYTGTYRVISADTHIVYGGLVFSIGHAGAAPKFTVAGLIGKNKSGKVTEVAFGVVRGLNYLTIALMLGGLAFLLFAWLPGAQRRSPAASQRWALASRAFARRLGTTVRGGDRARRARQRARRAAAGRERRRRVAVELAERLDRRKHAGQPLRQGVGRARDRLGPARRAAAGGAGRSARDAIRVLRGRAREPREPGADRRARRASCSRCLRSAPPTWRSPPRWPDTRASRARSRVFFPSDVLHVLAGGVWVGGIACLLLALPAATRRLRGRRAQPAAAGDARALLAARARRGGRDRRDRRDSGVHRRAQPARPVAHDLRRADHRQDRAAARR